MTPPDSSTGWHPPRSNPRTAEAAAARILEHPGMDVAREAGRVVGDAPLGAHTTYRVGGLTTLLVDAANEAELEIVADAIGRTGASCLVIGRGSNLLVADAGFAGISVRLTGDFEAITLPSRTVPGQNDGESALCRAGGAVLLPVLARATARAGWRGFEWAVGVPGSIGGAVMMNAGGHGSDMAASLVAARVLDLAGDHEAGKRTNTFSRDQLDLGYRRSALTPGQVVIWAELSLRPGDRGEAEAELSEIVGWRRRHQPGGPNAGSVFANPPGDSAGRLIEAAGLKGYRLGSAEVSTKHANFIQADPGGSADDVARLIAEVRRRVVEQFDVLLQPENRLVGFEAGFEAPGTRAGTKRS